MASAPLKGKPTKPQAPPMALSVAPSALALRSGRLSPASRPAATCLQASRLLEQPCATLANWVGCGAVLPARLRRRRPLRPSPLVLPASPAGLPSARVAGAGGPSAELAPASVVGGMSGTAGQCRMMRPPQATPAAALQSRRRRAASDSMMVPARPCGPSAAIVPACMAQQQHVSSSEASNAHFEAAMQCNIQSCSTVGACSG